MALPFRTRPSTSAMARRTRTAPCGSASATDSWSRSRESSLSIENQRRARSSRSPGSRAGAVMAAASPCAALEKSGSRPASVIARRAMPRSRPRSEPFVVPILLRFCHQFAGVVASRRKVAIMIKRLVLGLGLVTTLACGTAWSAPAVKTPAARPAPRSIALPGAPPEGGVAMDYIGYDPAHGRLWVPAGNTGSVDVIDVATEKVTRLEGFATKEAERNGRKRTMGPSSVAIGNGVVYVGNRGDDAICAIDAASLQKGPCTRLDSMPDALAVVPSAKEVWATTPGKTAIAVLDAASRSGLPVKASVSVPGEPESLAVDDARGVVYTNLEDK